MSNTSRIALCSALVSALALVGGLLLGVVVGFITFETLPGHMPEASKAGLAAIPALVGTFAGGAIWGRVMARLADREEARRMVWAGALGYGLAVILAGIGLSALEMAIVERGGGPALPVHVVFTILFVPAASFVAAVGGLALGIALRNWSLAGRLGLFGGLAAGVAFLVVNLLMDSLGWRVGAPGAAERFTMLTVMFTGNLAAALAGGAVIGVLLTRESVPRWQTPADS
jgi:MFS family permease